MKKVQTENNGISSKIPKSKILAKTKKNSTTKISYDA